MADTSALRSVGYVHILTGLVTFVIGIVSAALYLYMGWLCVGIWTGISVCLSFLYHTSMLQASNSILKQEIFLTITFVRVL